MCSIAVFTFVWSLPTTAGEGKHFWLECQGPGACFESASLAWPSSMAAKYKHHQPWPRLFGSSIGEVWSLLTSLPWMSQEMLPSSKSWLSDESEDFQTFWEWGEADTVYSFRLEGKTVIHWHIDFGKTGPMWRQMLVDDLYWAVNGSISRIKLRAQTPWSCGFPQTPKSQTLEEQYPQGQH